MVEEVVTLVMPWPTRDLFDETSVPLPPRLEESMDQLPRFSAPLGCCLHINLIPEIGVPVLVAPLPDELETSERHGWRTQDPGKTEELPVLSQTWTGHQNPPQWASAAS
jgi:hypothetical protein